MQIVVFILSQESKGTLSQGTWMMCVGLLDCIVRELTFAKNDPSFPDFTSDVVHLN